MTQSGDVYTNSFVLGKQSSVRGAAPGDRKDEEEENRERKTEEGRNSRNQEWQVGTRAGQSDSNGMDSQLDING